jgi:uncharacterized protein (UPF0332 family)
LLKVTIPNPEHLFQQAERLIESRPRQVDIRRAISAAYYALFHAVSVEAADNVMGFGNRKSELYGLVHRSVDHAPLRKLCEEIRRPDPTDKYRRFAPAGGFAPSIKHFAVNLVELQQKRHSADYDPLARFSRSEARLTIDAGRVALARFKEVSEDQRQIFASLLLFPPR